MKRGTKQSETAKWIGKEIAKRDRIWQGDSLANRVEKRAGALDFFPETRPVCYALAWGIATGRTSAEWDAALMALSAPRFAQIALDIVTAYGGAPVRDIWEAWKAVVVKAAA